MERVRLDLDRAEYAALARLAEQRLRPLPLEARHIVREALQQAGLLAAAASPPRIASPERVG
jgi:hypothetical protein